MKVVIFEKANVKIKRKKAQPSRDYSTVGHNNNKVVLIAEGGEVYLKAFNPQTGLVYVYSQIQSYANPDINLTDAKGVHVVLLVTRLKPEPSPYIFIFAEEEVAALFNACIFLAAKAAKADELIRDAETIGGDSVSNAESTSDKDDYDNFTPTQDFNAGAQARAQELLSSYKED